MCLVNRTVALHKDHLIYTPNSVNRPVALITCLLADVTLYVLLVFNGGINISNIITADP